MSDLLSIGASGVRAYQSALSTVSENIANVGASGYSRRTTTMREVAPIGGGLASRGIDAGSGVTVSGVARAGDFYAGEAVRTANADLQKTSASATWLDRIQSSLTGSTLDKSMTDFFGAATTLAADPSAQAPRSAMLESAQGVASSFRSTGLALDATMADIDQTGEGQALKLSSLAAELAKVNDGLARVPANSNSSAALADQRDQLLADMSDIVDIGVSIDNFGRATVNAGGAQGPLLLSGTTPGTVRYQRNVDGTIAFTVERTGQIASLTPNAGSLSGLVDGAQRVVDARAKLNALATDFVAGMNGIQAQGRDLNGNPGAALFTVGSNPTDLSVTLADPSGIAAAAPGGGPRDNSNLTALQSLRNSAGYETTLTAQVSANAATLAQRKTVVEAQTAIKQGASATLDQISGVNLDNEAVDLMRFQQAYQASSRIIQSARDIFQSILEIR
ncbi:Flagellar hook-associated protein FlgK [Sphingomonas sp. EC-HK361]|uniref:flagellar hook-associated protein FlgK n=1 Tax=Sphingomonas sp. EC-HK361 TaxID=2038397 RepID=UPI00125C05AF|nr:flagellar hook-associated protein FlgK [Sphingomonas sp. EC-HK361]VVT16285.1 Flagellar hook-associated protein FlgK [Sphingomonas sp. EC-HK361]